MEDIFVISTNDVRAPRARDEPATLRLGGWPAGRRPRSGAVGSISAVSSRTTFLDAVALIPVGAHQIRTRIPRKSICRLSIIHVLMPREPLTDRRTVEIDCDHFIR